MDGRCGRVSRAPLEDRLTPIRGEVFAAQLPLRDGSFERKYCAIVSLVTVLAEFHLYSKR